MEIHTNRVHACTFIGHRKAELSQEQIEKVKSVVESLIVEHGVSEFLFGSKSEFDSLCWEIVTELKRKYPHIRRINVRAEYRYVYDDYLSSLLTYYEESFYPDEIADAGRQVYVARNRYMIDRAEYCVFYLLENYTPPQQPLRKHCITPISAKSGTKVAYEYAKRKKREIILI